MGATGAGISGLTGSHNTGSGLTGSHSTGSGFTGTSSGMPGGYDGTSATHGTSSTGLGNSGVGLTGPVHDSAMLNKLDPRVKDTTGTGSATGGNSTYQTCLVSNSPKTVNNRDAAHVPPSQHADYGNVQNQTSDHHKRHGSGPTGDLKKDIIAHGCGTK
ncbi:hypothetical protein LTR04_002370 [Oleoguttula sp. CCFEE 6159]|nr:hypothetical protein LTR04_002370 [Oleoguttula sp. CCFEE 6159]